MQRLDVGRPIAILGRREAQDAVQAFQASLVVDQEEAEFISAGCLDLIV